MIPFRYDEAIIAKFPHLAGGAILGMGLSNGSTPDALRQAFQDEQHKVIERIGSTPLSEIETLVGWRSAFRAFGVDPTQYRSAVEALLRRLTKKGDIPSINAVVDACNLVSIRHGLPVAAVDLRHVQGTITVRFATGEEWFTNLGTDAPEHPAPGEVIFIDEAGLVIARRWCWRQSEESAAREGEQLNILFTIEAQHAGSKDAVVNALADLQALLAQHTQGAFESCLIAPSTP